MTTVHDEGTSTTPTSISAVHPDILRDHILTRLDGLTLVSASCSSSELNFLASEGELWCNMCRSTWPSTDAPRMRQLISTFPPAGPRSFFSSSFPLLSSSSSPANICSDRPTELISAVDIFYKNDLIFSKVVETETISGWFRCSPFRIDMLDPKDTCPTPIPHPETDEGCRELAEELTLSWILIDPVGKRAMNLSSHKPVSVQRHWLSGEVHARFVTVVKREDAGRGLSSSLGVVQCGILVTFGVKARAGGGGLMDVREVSMQVEDLDGMFLNGKDSLGILRGAFEGKKGIRGREAGRRRYDEFLEMKRERKESKLRKEGTLDMLCVAFGVGIFVSLTFFVLFR